MERLDLILFGFVVLIGNLILTIAVVYVAERLKRWLDRGAPIAPGAAVVPVRSPDHGSAGPQMMSEDEIRSRLKDERPNIPDHQLEAAAREIRAAAGSLGRRPRSGGFGSEP